MANKYQQELNQKQLLSAQELQHLLHEPNTILFDVRHDLMNHQLGRQQYMQGHIPGAYFLDTEVDLTGAITPQSGRHPLPDFTQFRALMLRYGVDQASHVVVYDASQGAMAARMWWLLQWAGFERVSILDGGWQAWLAAHGVIDTHLALPRVSRDMNTEFSVGVSPQQSIMQADQIVAQLKASTSDYVLLDARAAERYRGEKEPIDPVAGHIPTALNRPVSENLQENGCFKPAAQLHTEFKQLLGDVNPESVVHYCGSGVAACHNLFAMNLAGLRGSALYPGSWSEWMTNPDRPRGRDV